MEDFAVNAAESTDEFWKVFNQNVSLLKQRFQELPGDENAVKELIALFKTRVSQLQSFATESTSVLPPYDVRRSQEILDGLHSELKTVEERARPRKKFAFSSRAPKASPPAAPLAPASSGVPSAPAPAEKESAAPALPPGSFVVSHRENEEVTFTYEQILSLLSPAPASAPAPAPASGPSSSSSSSPSAPLAINLHLLQLSHCTLRFPLPLGSVRCEGLAHCTLLLGPTCSSVYVDASQSLCLSLSAHQLRIHNTSLSSICCRTKSPPIVEDCAGLSFGPCLWDYPALPQHLVEAGLESSPLDLWQKVVDFRWHKPTPSPHWKKMTEGEIEETRARILGV